IGLALHNYESTYAVFPAGNVTHGPCCGTKSRATWTIDILPFLEQDALHKRYNYDFKNEDPPNEFVRTQFVKTYTCPSDLDTNKTDVPGSGPGSDLNLQYARGSYRAVSGRSGVTPGGQEGRVFWDTCENNLGALNLQWRGLLHSMGGDNPIDAPGTPPERRCPAHSVGRERMANVTDGTSNTLMVGEYTT